VGVEKWAHLQEQRSLKVELHLRAAYPASKAAAALPVPD